MRRLLLALPIALIVAHAAHADDASDLRDRALKAHAKDPADLKKFRVHTLKAKGISYMFGSEPTPVTWEIAAVWPGHMRLTWGFGKDDRKSTVTVATAGDRGWRGGSGMITENLGIEALNDIRTDGYAIWVSTLTTLQDAETKLAVAGKSKVNSDPVVGLKVSRRPWPDITLFFDEKSGLLRKMAYRSRESGVFLNKDFIYNGHKEVSGLMVPSKQTMFLDGKEAHEFTELEFAFPDKLEMRIFEKP